MKIAKSTIQQQSSHLYAEEHHKRESLTAWKADQEPANSTERQGRGVGLQLGIAETLEKSQATEVSLSTEALKSRPQKAFAAAISEEEMAISSLNIRILRELVERVTGRKFVLAGPPSAEDMAAHNNVTVPEEGTGGELEAPPESQGAGFGVIYDYYESHYEYEQTSFSASGIVQTEDGQEISIAIELNMTREFLQEEGFSLRAGEALKDPLVLNFDGNATDLTERNFSFDIDADGKEDQIAFVGRGSGFLALDKNGDNQINDGTELFGAQTGDGFAELAAYDEDGNGWIDENDSVFDRLRIWMNDGSGEPQLIALGAKDVGAIYLGHMDTPFLLKDENNELEGQVRSSGIFLKEDGAVRTVQQIDLVA